MRMDSTKEALVRSSKFFRRDSFGMRTSKLSRRKNFELQTNAAVHTILMDRSTGKARGVTYIDTRNGLEYEAYGKAVVLAASLVESIRILMNSRNRDYPSGLANTSGTLGPYLMEHVAFNSN